MNSEKAPELHLWQAIHLMRELTAKGETFSLAFATYDRSRKLCHGMSSL